MMVALVFMVMLMSVTEMIAERQRKSDRISCEKNLKQVGIAYRVFANDQASCFPPLEKKLP